MIWLPLLLLAPFLGFQCPIIQAAYTVDAPYRNHLHNFPNSHSAVNSQLQDSTKYDYTSTSESAAMKAEDNNPVYLRVMPSSEYNKNAPGRLNGRAISNNQRERMDNSRARNISSRNSAENSEQLTDRDKIPPSSNEIIIPQPLAFSALGVAIIYSPKAGIICSGVHLKPWILLTTADCVYRTHPEDLYAQVTKWEGKNSMPVTLNAKVMYHEIHPGYRYTNYKSHNLAIVGLKTRASWDVDEFGIPKTPKGKDFKPENLVTYVNEWNELRTPRNKSYILALERKFISTNFTACNGQKPDNGFFCVSDGHSHDVYEQIDVGIPLFYREGASKVLLGIYSGEDLNDGVTGHMFLSIYDNLFWVVQKVLENPLPPVN